MSKIFITIFLILIVIIALFTYLIILGASKCKSIEEQNTEEQNTEDEEQMEYLRNYKKKGDNK